MGDGSQSCRPAVFRLAQKQVTPRERGISSNTISNSFKRVLKPLFPIQTPRDRQTMEKPAIFGRVVSSKGHKEGRYSIPTVTVQVI